MILKRYQHEKFSKLKSILVNILSRLKNMNFIYNKLKLDIKKSYFDKSLN